MRDYHSALDALGGSLKAEYVFSQTMAQAILWTEYAVS